MSSLSIPTTPTNADESPAVVRFSPNLPKVRLARVRRLISQPGWRDGGGGGGGGSHRGCSSSRLGVLI